MDSENGLIGNIEGENENEGENEEGVMPGLSCDFAVHLSESIDPLQFASELDLQYLIPFYCVTYILQQLY